MKKLNFTKMQGLGNDFMMVNAVDQLLSLTPQQIRKLSDRHLGIGFDQLLVVAKSSEPKADFDYLIFNSDGSRAQQCTNGARCMARFIREQGLSQKNDLSLWTAGRLTRVRIESDQTVTVEMEEPYFEPEKIPFKSSESKPPYHFLMGKKSYEFQIAGVGNPHAVIIVDEIKPSEVKKLGAALGCSAHFPEGANVGLMQIVNPNQVNLQVYERGAGLTLACGSGACAAVAVGVRLGLLKNQVQVSQLGGHSWIEWQGLGSRILMRGPAELVYQGSLFLTSS